MNIQTFSGIQMNPLQPRQEDINLTDIAHALSHLCRFGGHSSKFYSVAQHSTLVAQIAKSLGGTKEEIFGALLHDATEAYLVDIPRPVKHQLKDYQIAEKNLEHIISQKFNVSLHSEIIKKADVMALKVEAFQLMKNANKWEPLKDIDDFDFKIKALNPTKSKELFLNFFELCRF